ncbi:MAG: MmgE/PrpD family protein [Pseudorhodoplanes sp.]
MASVFTERLCDAVRACDGGDAAMRGLIGRAMVDTLGVAAAGFSELVTRLTLDAYRGGGAACWSGDACESEEAAVMIDAIAAHALDFDDVFLESAIHPSTVILPAVLRPDRNDAPSEIVAAFGAGLIAAQAVAARVGLGHYHKGWHGTGTIGAFAAAAAAGRLRRLDERQLATMFSIVASQSAGLKVNFGTMTKPAHAGFAAAAGVRAAHLAQAGFTAAEDIFGPGGYADLYGTPDGREHPADDVYRLRADRIALKLYPCCYGTHRLIGIALDARAALGSGLADDRTRIRVTVPKGSIDVLRYDRPRTGLEAKFSGPYTIAVALLDGLPTLDHFVDEATSRPDVQACMERISVVQDSTQDSGGDIEFGTVTLDAFDNSGKSRGSFSRHAIPGSPDDPPSPQDVLAKFESCTGIFARARGTPLPVLRQGGAIPEVRHWLQGASESPVRLRAAGGR